MAPEHMLAREQCGWETALHFCFHPFVSDSLLFSTYLLEDYSFSRRGSSLFYSSMFFSKLVVTPVAPCKATKRAVIC